MHEDSPITSQSLLDQMQRPETRDAAWATFVGRYEAVLRGWATRAGLRAAAADDVVAMVLTKLLHHLPKYDRQRPFRPWLWTVVKNAARDLKKTNDRTPGAVGSGKTDVVTWLAEVPSRGGDLSAMVEGIAEEYEAALRVAATVSAQVNPKHWQAFLLSQVDAERDGEEIARQVGLASRQAVYQAVYRVRQIIRSEFRRLGSGPTGE